MKVKILVSIASTNWDYRPGEVADLPPDLARRWIEADIAAPLEPEAATTEAPERATLPRPKRRTKRTAT